VGVSGGGPSGTDGMICLRVGHFRGCRMLRLVGEQVESLFDEALPIEVRELPEHLARVDELLSDPRAGGADRGGVGRRSA
jgi:hypothetical protein